MERGTAGKRLARASPGLAQVRLIPAWAYRMANWAFRNPSPWSFWKVSWPTIRPSIANLPRYSSSRWQVLQGHSNRRSRVVLAARTAVWRIHFCIHARPQLNIAPAASAFPDMPTEVFCGRQRNNYSSNNSDLAIPRQSKWRQIEQPLSVDSALCYWRLSRPTI